MSLVLALCSYAVQSLVAGIEPPLGHVGVSRMFSGNFGGGLWIAFIGWFLDNAASAQVHAVMFQSLACCPATQFPRAMSSRCSAVPADLRLTTTF